jgi:Transglycosylase-like domain
MQCEEYEWCDREPGHSGAHIGFKTGERLCAPSAGVQDRRAKFWGIVLLAVFLLAMSIMGDPAYGHYNAPASVDRAAHRYFGSGVLGAKALRVSRCESNWVRSAVSRSGRYHGLFQFDYPTWRSVGGRSRIAQSTVTEQFYRARKLYDRRGWQPWPVCGKR